MRTSVVLRAQRERQVSGMAIGSVRTRSRPASAGQATELPAAKLISRTSLLNLSGRWSSWFGLPWLEHALEQPRLGQPSGASGDGSVHRRACRRSAWTRVFDLTCVLDNWRARSHLSHRLSFRESEEPTHSATSVANDGRFAARRGRRLRSHCEAADVRCWSRATQSAHAAALSGLARILL